MKKIYETPALVHIVLSNEDVLTASNPLDMSGTIDNKLTVGWGDLSGTK